MTTFQKQGQVFLQHFGRKGMKWGVRRTDAQLKGDSAKGKNEENPSKAKPSTSTTTSTKGLNNKTDTSKLSDAQLKAAVNRLNMEQQYAKLTERKTIVEKGASFLAGVAVNVAKQQLTAVVNEQANVIKGQLTSGKAKTTPKPPKPPAFAPPRVP